MVTTLLVFAGAIVGFVLKATIFAPKPAPAPEPEPKKFGAKEARALRGKLGGLTLVQGVAAKVAVAVSGMDYTLPADLKAEKEAAAAAVLANEKAIEQYKARIGVATQSIAVAKADSADAASIAAAFGEAS